MQAHGSEHRHQEPGPVKGRVVGYDRAVPNEFCEVRKDLFDVGRVRHIFPGDFGDFLDFRRDGKGVGRMYEGAEFVKHLTSLNVQYQGANLDDFRVLFRREASGFNI